MTLDQAVALSLMSICRGVAPRRAAADGDPEPARARRDAGSRGARDRRRRAAGGHPRRSPGTIRAYPAALAAIADPPPVLWMRGDRAALSRAGRRHRRIARGVRRGARDGRRGSARDLAARGVTVVSGLARGVDSAAHRGALAPAARRSRCSARASTSSTRPSTRRWRARSPAGARHQRALPGTPPLPCSFRGATGIISGLSRAVVVIEAGEKSGSLITARCALEQGRDVLAVPGNVLSGRNRGGHALLRDGARIVETADDILEELGLAPMRRGSAIAGGRARDRTRSALAADPVLGRMAVGRPCDLDALSERSGLDGARAAAAAVRPRTAGAGAARSAAAGSCG